MLKSSISFRNQGNLSDLIFIIIEKVLVYFTVVVHGVSDAVKDQGIGADFDDPEYTFIHHLCGENSGDDD